MSAASLLWGQRVRTPDGHIGQYEGILCAERSELLRVSFVFEDGSSGVCYLEAAQLSAVPEHPVCLARRLRAAGIRPPRRLGRVTPACYLKDYGPTAIQRAYAAWEQGLENDDPETFGRLWNELQRAHFIERSARKPRRLTHEAVAIRLDRQSANDRRWLRTRKQLRAIARSAGSTS